jgi:hypothetical protein
MNIQHGKKSPQRLLAALVCAISFGAHADVVTEWNTKVGELMVEVKLTPPPGMRVAAYVQTAVYEAVNAITKRYPQSKYKVAVASGASVEAAVAAANHGVLSKLLPANKAQVDALYATAIGQLSDDLAKRSGIEAGYAAANAVLEARGDDGAGAQEAYRFMTSPGTYVPTSIPAASTWPQRKPWNLSSPSQFRPAPPPKLNSALYARDYNEVKTIGSKNSKTRSAEQSDIARFWDFGLPPIYHGVVRSIASRADRDVTQNARLFATVAQAQDDAMIASWEAKYHYNFWRPITAIRNGDIDGNTATERDPSWLPFVDTPMHPEYPTGHGVLVGALGAVLKAELGGTPLAAPLSSTSATAKGMTRTWSGVDELIREVVNARVYEGVHFRNSMEVAATLGAKVGDVAAKQLMGAR